MMVGIRVIHMETPRMGRDLVFSQDCGRGMNIIPTNIPMISKVFGFVFEGTKRKFVV